MELTHPRPHRWTVEDFERLWELDFFGPEPRVELVDGQIVELEPMNPPHANAVTHATSTLVTLFDATHWVRVQLPVRQGRRSRPQPDLALIPKSADESNHPSLADLLIEMSETSLGYDRTTKASLYARHGSPELWIVNLVDRQLEVFRDPQADATQSFGATYRTRLILRPGDTIAPLCRPDVTVQVSRLF